MPILDYQKDNKIPKNADPLPPREIFKSTVKRAMILNRFHKKSNMKLSGLMNMMVMRKLEEDRKQEKQRN
jgi:hypothetical protein